jgi:hypothetical protein
MYKYILFDEWTLVCIVTYSNPASPGMDPSRILGHGTKGSALLIFVCCCFSACMAVVVVLLVTGVDDNDDGPLLGTKAVAEPRMMEVKNKVGFIVIYFVLIFKLIEERRSVISTVK